jgi:arylsulfatase A-like enzyme
MFRQDKHRRDIQAQTKLHRWQLLPLCGWMICLPLNFVAGQDADRQSPNVIVIMADDLGYHDLGFQGSQRIQSPNLDALAKSGTVFTDAHVTASVCSPSRAGFITGRYQTRFGHEANVPPRGKGMDLAELTIGTAFGRQGYRTGVLGKWHLGSTDAQNPTERGFDEFWGLREGSRSYWYNAKKNDRIGDPHAIESNGTPVKFEGHLSDRLGDQAVGFIKRNKDDPFFLFLSFTAPHGPLEAKPADLKKCGGDPYAALIYNMDLNIGKVLNSLETLGLRDNTMVWFLSDNGGVAKQASNKPLKGTKGLKFEGGHRVPFVLSWPGHVPAGKTYDGLTSSMDIFPTSLIAAGGELPTERPLDGVDLLPNITDKTDQQPHQQLFWRRLDCSAVRIGGWKLISVPSAEALYRVDQDISETNNLATSMPEKAAELRTALETWDRQQVAPLWKESKKWMNWTVKAHRELQKNRPLPTSP